ncbi:MAG: hypothetical protein WCJ93_10805 [Methanomicrobiales archaeon]
MDRSHFLFTGKGREEVIIQAINRGADFYLQKDGAPKARFVELSDKIHAETAPIHTRPRKNGSIFQVYNVQALHGPGGG